MPVGTDGSTVDFPNPQLVDECSTFGYSFDYACAEGDTYSVQFDWKTLVLNDLSGKGVTVQAPVTGTYRIAVSGEAITGPTGATGATGANWRGQWQSSTSYVYGDVVFDSSHANWNLSSLVSLGITNGSFVCISDHTSGNSNRPGRNDSTNLWQFVAGGLVGSTGARGSTGPEGITMPGNPLAGTFVYYSGTVNGVREIQTVNPLVISPVLGGGNLVRFDVGAAREQNYFLSPNTSNFIIIDAPAAGNGNTKHITQTINLEYIRLGSAWGTGDYVNLFLHQPSNDTITFTSHFKGGNTQIDLDHVHFAGGYTLPVASDINEIDLFHIYCIGLTAAGVGNYQPMIVVNHQQFHDGV